MHNADHRDIQFKTQQGKKAKLVWQKAEYRAFLYNTRYDEWQDLKLGATIPKALKEYVEKYF